MSSVNRVQILGHLGRDPEIRQTGNGGSVCNFTMATSEKWKDKVGESQERTEWHRIVVWGKTAELCAQYLRKGRQAFIEGRLQTREWEKDGMKRTTTEIVADKVTFVGGGEKRESQPDTDAYSPRAKVSGPPAPPEMDDDIPF
jgi:single-strand DNA-binding protein